MTPNRALKARKGQIHPVVNHLTFLTIPTTLGTSVVILETMIQTPRMMVMEIQITFRVLPLPPILLTCSLNFLIRLADPPMLNQKLGSANQRFTMARIKQSCAHSFCNAILTSMTAPALFVLDPPRFSMLFPIYPARHSSILNPPSSARLLPSLFGLEIGPRLRTSFK